MSENQSLRVSFSRHRYVSLRSMNGQDSCLVLPEEITPGQNCIISQFMQARQVPKVSFAASVVRQSLAVSQCLRFTSQLYTEKVRLAALKFRSRGAIFISSSISTLGRLYDNLAMQGDKSNAIGDYRGIWSIECRSD